MTIKNKPVNQLLKAEGLLPLNLQYFSEQPVEPPAGEPPTDPTSGGSEPTPPAEPPKEPENTYTQEDVNNVVAKEVRTAQENLFKELGIENFENAKEGFQKFQEWQESQKTEQEKQQEQLKTLSTEKETLSSENQSLKSQLSALKQGVKSESVEDVVALAERRVNEETTIDEAIKQVVEEYPHFAQERQEGTEPNELKPQFSKGQHQKQTLSEKDKWLSAFTNTK